MSDHDPQRTISQHLRHECPHIRRLLIYVIAYQDVLERLGVHREKAVVREDPVGQRAPITLDPLFVQLRGIGGPESPGIAEEEARTRGSREAAKTIPEDARAKRPTLPNQNGKSSAEEEQKDVGHQKRGKKTVHCH